MRRWDEIEISVMGRQMAKLRKSQRRHECTTGQSDRGAGHIEHPVRTVQLLTNSLKGFPGVKRGALLAWIFTGSPVRGFLAIRAARFLTEKEPNPVKIGRAHV